MLGSFAPFSHVLAASSAMPCSLLRPILPLPFSNAPPLHRFEDARLDFPAWGALKATGFGPLGQLPVLEIEGEQMCQSIPMSAYAARKAGLYPTEALEAFRQEEVVAITDELWNKIGTTSKDRPESRVAYGEETAPKYLALLAKRLGDKPFFAGAAPGWADLWVYIYCTMFSSGFFDHVAKDFVARHAPALAALVERIKASELYQKHGNPE